MNPNEKPPTEDERKPPKDRPDCELPENAPENLDGKLDYAPEETFPTSDPVSINITK